MDAEYPTKADLRKDVALPLPKIAPDIVDPASMAGDAPAIQVKAVLDVFNAALATNDVEKLASCFYSNQAFWRDIVALTSHLRTIKWPRIIATTLLKMFGLRGLAGKVELSGDPHFVVLNPSMMFINCQLSFGTHSPSLDCEGKWYLLPVNINGTVHWKIWVMSTWVKNLVQQPEDERLLSAPGRKLDGPSIETDVVIIGGGSSGLMMAARLKAHGVESVIIERNAQVGESWAKRYDSLEIHVPTSSCELPYISYPKELQTPHLLTKGEVVEHLQQYAKRLNLNTILLAKVKSSMFNESEKQWTVRVITADGERTIVSKHLIQATGMGGGRPYIPSIEGGHRYRGVNQHSVQYRNAKVLAEQGVKSIAIIGSANTAFDIMTDCYKAGLTTTMIARSPTYLIPIDYVMNPHSIGAFDHMPLDAADKYSHTSPLALDGQFAQGLFAHLDFQKPDRYLALQQSGFPVLEAGHATGNVQHTLFERGGGHYVDIGGTKLIAEGKVSVRGLVEPVGFNESGLRLSDGSMLDVDAVMWCTGFDDANVRTTARDMLGADETGKDTKEGILGPTEISTRLDASWGVDAEGEVRGLWKRHLRMNNYWVIGGGFQHQRWWSRVMAQQIKLALDGSLPPAYRDTPMVA